MMVAGYDFLVLSVGWGEGLQKTEGSTGQRVGSILVARSDLNNWLLQLRVLGFGFSQDGDVGIGVFP